MKSFSTISIIYNPVSTGSSQQLATEFAAELLHTPLKDVVQLLATKHAGHAETLAYELAKASSNPLIISSSGDGGYHEVINGAMRARADGANPTTGLLPAGNANDHYHNVHTDKIVERIVSHDSSRIDLLHISATLDGAPWARYAHSYIGIGLTPTVGKALNKVELTPLNEPWVVLKAFTKLRPATVLMGGKRRAYDSLIFSTVTKMSKVLTLSEDADMFDGLLEVTAQPSQSKLHLLLHLFRAVGGGLEPARQTDTFSFTAIKPLSIQLDGELFMIDAHSPVTITCNKRALPCLI